jgi:methionyl-tRNA formyltransferase
MLLAERITIGGADTTASLTDKLGQLGARLIVVVLEAAARGELRARLQPAEGVTYARKIDKREAWLDWSRPAEELARRVRAFDPFPVACAQLHGTTLKLWRADAERAHVAAAPGTVVAVDGGGVHVACGAGTLAISELQRPGGKRLRAAEFLAGLPIVPGDAFGGAPEAE